jgi:hypothetical protein
MTIPALFIPYIDMTPFALNVIADISCVDIGMFEGVGIDPELGDIDSVGMGVVVSSMRGGEAAASVTTGLMNNKPARAPKT